MIREVIIGGSFNPPGNHHFDISAALTPHFDRLRIFPCGMRPDKLSTNDVSPLHRAAMVDLAFGGLGDKVTVDLSDIRQGGEFTRTYDVNERYNQDGVELWHAVGTDLLEKRHDDGLSDIERWWYRGRELLETARFAVIVRDGFPLERCTLPRHYDVWDAGSTGSSMLIRATIQFREPYTHLVPPTVADFIERHNIYRGHSMSMRGLLHREPVRAYLHYYADERTGVNPKTARVIDDFERLGVRADLEDANVIIVIGGDGTMLDATRQFYRRRLPFFGVNTGGTGYQLNDVTAEETIAALANGVESYLLSMLECECMLESGEVVHHTAYNEAYAEKYCRPGAKGKQASHFSLHVRSREDNWPERYCERIVGSHLMVSTPQGSTGYAQDLDHDPLMIDSQSLLLVGGATNQPIGWRGMPLPGDAEVMIEVLDNDKRPADGNFDNVSVGPIRKLTIRKSYVAGAEICFLRGYSPAMKLMNARFPRY